MAAREVQHLFAELKKTIPSQQGDAQEDQERAGYLMQNIGRYLEQQLTTADFDLIVSTLFSNDDINGSILECLESVRERKDFVSFKAESCKIIKCLLPKAGKSFVESKGPGIKRTARLLYCRLKEASKVRVEALQLLVAVVAACAGTSAADEMAARQLVEDLLQKDLVRNDTPTVRQQQLHLLGALCQHYPAQTAPLADRVCRILIADLERQLDSRSAKLEKAIVAGAIQGLTCFLHSFSKSPDDDPAVCEKIYNSVLRVIRSGWDLTRREAPRAGLALLSAHAGQFAQHMFSDHQQLSKCLLTWARSNNRDDARAGIAALDALVDQMCQMLGEATDADQKLGDPSRPVTAFSAFSYMLAWLKRELSSVGAESPSGVVLLAVRGYGNLAGPCRRLCPPDDLDRLVTSLTDKAEQHYLGGGALSEERLLQLPGYVWALGSCVAALPAVPAGQLAGCERLLLLLAEQYPRVPPTHRFLAHGAAAHTLLVVLRRPELAQPCLNRLVYQMLLRTCSHPVAVESDLQKDAAVSFAERPISYKDYLSLWDTLLTAHTLRDLTRKGITQAALSSLSSAVYRGLVESAQKMMAELDLGLTRLEDDAPPQTGNPADALQARVPKDFQVFINLVSVLEHVLLSQPAALLEPWLPLLARQVVRDSCASPLVSGLYRLARVCLLVAGQLHYFEEEAGSVAMETDAAVAGGRRQLRRLLSAHVTETAERCGQYRDELREACVSMVLAAPAPLAADCAGKLLHVVQTALRLGRSHLPLATRALDALDRWLPVITARDGGAADCSEPLTHIVPALNQYLSTDPAMNAFGTENQKERSSTAKRRPTVDVKRIAKAQLIPESELAVLRSRVFQLLGQLAAAGLVPDSHSDLVAWSRKHVLGLDLPFQDVKPTLWLETFLPRVVELALSSGSAQAKASACELLHTITIFIVGKGAARGLSGDSLRLVCSRLLPALVRLAAGPSLLAIQLFRPLLAQLTHWLTTDQMYRRPEAAILLQTLLDGLADSSDSSLRDVCAETLSEYLEWSLKQQRGSAVQKVEPIMTPLYSYLRHPDPYRRLGGTLAFNSVYRVFREDASLLDVYLLEVTAALMAALARAHADPAALGTEQAAAEAVRHCLRMLKKCAPQLTEVSVARHVPLGWQQATLAGLLSWLVSQCGAPQTEYRHACYQLISELAPLSPGAGSVRDLMDAGGGPVAVLERSLTLPGARGPVEAAVWLEAVLAALDGYSWAADVAPPPAGSHLLDNVRFLLSEAFRAAFGEGAPAGRWAALRRLRCAALVRALSVLEPLLRRSAGPLAGLWSPAVCDTLAAAALAPAELGFDVREPEVARRLPAALRDLLRTAARAAERRPSLELTAALARRAGRRPLPDTLRTALTGDGDPALEQLLYGLQTLHDSDFLPKLTQASPELGVSGDALFAVVWEAAVQRTGSKLQTADQGPAALRLAETALSTALHIGVTPQLVLSSLLSTEPVWAGAGGDATTERGWVFFSRHSAALVSRLLAPAARQAVLAPLLARAAAAPRALDLVTAVVRAAAADRLLRQRFGGDLAELVGGGWSQLCSSPERHLLPLASLLLTLRPALAAERWAQPLVAWYRDVLEGTRLTLEQKNPALRLLHAMMKAPELAENVCTVLERLESLHFPLRSSELAGGSVARAAYLAALAALCETVQLSGHPPLAAHLVALLSSESGHPSSDRLRTALRAAVRSHDTSRRLALSERLYALCWPEGAALTPSARLAVLTGFLCPTLRAGDRGSLIQFYCGHVTEIVQTIQKPAPPCLETESESTEHQWASRTAGFCLLDVLYGSLSKEHVHSATSPVVTAFAGTSAGGNELTKALVAAGSAAFKCPASQRAEAAGQAEARRRCLCAAYNALVAAVCTTQDEPRFYNTLLFKEDPARHQVIWERLVDGRRQYSFPLDRPAVLRRREVSVRQREGQQAEPGPLRPAAAPGSVGQLLSGGSLFSQVTEYDFTASVVLTSQEAAELAFKQDEEAAAGVSVVRLAQDDLNDHECMPYVVALTQHMVDRIDPPKTAGMPAGPAPWVASLRDRLLSANTPDNVALFVAQLVVNSEPAFRPYGTWLLRPLCRLLADHRLGTELNALIMDVLAMLAVWAEEEISPDDSLDPDSVATARDLLEFVVRRMPNKHRPVVKDMADIFSRLVSGWCDVVTFPAAAVGVLLSGDRQLHSQMAGLGALLAALRNDKSLGIDGAQQWRLVEETILKLLSTHGSEIYRPASEVVARLFEKWSQAATQPEVEDAVQTVKTVLEKLERDDRVRWITCLAHMSRHCPRLALCQRARLLYNLPSVYGEQKTLAVQALHDIIADVPDVQRQLTSLQLPRLAEIRDLALQESCLRLLLRLAELNLLTADGWRAYLPAIASAVNDGDTPCRKLAAELCIVLRKRHRSEVSEAAGDVSEYVTGALLALLTDPDLVVRQTAANHWSDSVALTQDSTAGRLRLVLTEMFHPGLEQAYLSYSTYLVLGLTARSPDFERKLFERALPECQFQELPICSDWRLQSTAVLPLFSQPQSQGTAGGAGAGALPALLRATQQGLAFTPTQAASARVEGTVDWLTQGSLTLSDVPTAGTSPNAARRAHHATDPLRYADDTTDDREGEGDSGPEPAARRRRRRLETDARRVSARFARLHADQRALRDERDRDLPAKQDNKVELLRRYRQGELPDTEIPYSDLIRPLQGLAMHDPPTARLLLVELLVGTLEKLADQSGEPADTSGAALAPARRRRPATENPEYTSLLEAASAGLQKVLRCMRSADRSLVSAALLAALRIDIRLPTALVVSVCKMSGELPVSILLLEKILGRREAEEPPHKQARISEDDATDQLWTGLAELYRLSGDPDSARAALSRRSGLDADWSRALEAEASGDYLSAARRYKNALENGADDLIDESYFQCLSQLSEWTSLSDSVDLRLTRGGRVDLNAIWESDQERSLDHLLPWLVRSKTRLALDYDLAARGQLDEFLAACQADEHRRCLVESRLPEELAVYYVACDDLARARNYCEAAKTAFLRDWSAASASGGHSRKQLLQQLRRISELQEFLCAASEKSPPEVASALLGHWQARFPAKHEGLDFWDSIITRRQLFGDRLRRRLSAGDAARLDRSQRVARLRLVDAALQQDNLTAAGRHLAWLRSRPRDVSDTELTAEYHLLRSRADLLRAWDGHGIVEAWRALECELPWRQSAAALSAPLLLRRARLETRLAERLAQLPGTQQHEPFVRHLVAQTLPDSDQGNMSAAVTELAFRRLSEAMERTRESPHAAETCLEVAKFCSRHMDCEAEAPSELHGRLRSSFVTCTLAAMCAGSTEAIDWLPQLLQLADEHSDAADAFTQKYGPVPVWAFLGWLPQLFSYGSSPRVGAAARELLLRLAETYPQAVVYPLTVCEAGQPGSAEMADCLKRARQLLGTNQLPQRLIVELEKLTAEVEKLTPELKKRTPTAKDIEIALSACSAWMASFQDVDSTERLELPGQYTGTRKPTPDYHVHVANFGPQVAVLRSAKWPVRLSVRGDDAREYRYLVKTGDDLRTDQRLQQLFAIINGSLAADPQTASRRLSIRTYKVLPLKPTLGLIEWLDRTETLRDFLGSGFAERAVEAQRLHQRQLLQALPALGSTARPAELHAAYISHTPRQTVVEQYQQRRHKIGQTTLLRDALYQLSNGPESFLRLRTNLAVSHALLSAAGWLLGVGDRHLANFLVSLDDGSLIGIDFGMAFGAAAHLPVPELVPFRMTPQLANVTAPLGSAGLCEQTLCRAVHALRASHQLLAATLAVFVREPTVDWMERLRRDGHTHDGHEYGRQCVRVARRRLDGGHPSRDVCNLLASSPHLSTAEVTAWSAAARGKKTLDPRADLPDTGLTVQQQVTCLMDLATDPYVLGLAYVGWEAHI